MGSTATKAADNMYYRCRKEAALYDDRLSSREGASEQLGISVSTLSDYELGLTKVVPNDMVCKMAALYNAPQLRAQYCATECPIGRGEPIATEIKSIELATVQFMAVLNADAVEHIKTKLIEIAADGIISDDEKGELSEILQQLDDLHLVIDEIRLLGQKFLHRER